MQQCKGKLHFGLYADIPSDGLYWRAFTDHDEND